MRARGGGGGGGGGDVDGEGSGAVRVTLRVTVRAKVQQARKQVSEAGGEGPYWLPRISGADQAALLTDSLCPLTHFAH